MTEQELAEKLRTACVRSAPRRTKTQAVLLFGAWYRDELSKEWVSVERVRKLADAHGETGNIDATIRDGMNARSNFDINEGGRWFASFLGFESG